MIKVAWLSDVHFNFVPYLRFRALCDEVKAEKPDVVLISGDIGEAPSFADSLVRFAKNINDCEIFFVLGNHDYYGCVSIEKTRAVAKTLNEVRSNLHYLPSVGPVFLDTTVALLGVDGWGDARNGDYKFSTFELNDFILIPELKVPRGFPRIQVLQDRGDVEAKLLRRQLSDLHNVEKTIVLTHVPPFIGATWHLGKQSEPDALPYFSCAATGYVLLEHAEYFRGVEFLVLCGHTHSGGEYKPRPNMNVLTAQATYGKPEVQKIIKV